MSNVTVLNVPSTLKITENSFYDLCRVNPELRLERTATGALIIMPPIGGEGSRREADITTELNLWNRQTQLGVVFSPSAGFRLPNGADRSPDAAWVTTERWEALTPQQRSKFPPLAPDFVIELRSASDGLRPLQEKMQEYQANGVRLGWLINPQAQQVEIYRLGQAVEVLNAPHTLSGEAVLPGFILDLSHLS
jgi:Uma2 family endonuclease